MDNNLKLHKINLVPYLYVLPALIFSAAFLYYSIGFTIYTSFHEWNGLTADMKFVGLKNYIDLFGDPVIYVALFNNFIYMLFVIGAQIFVGLFLAVLLRAKLFGHTFFKSLFFFPVILAPVVIAGVFRIMMDPNMGSINQLLTSVHLDALAIPWLADPRYALMSIIIVNIFEWMGFAMVLYVAGLLAIPEDIYESAKIDGSGFWNTFFKITFPMVSGTTTTMIIIGINGGLKAFDIIMMLTNGGPGYSTEFLNTYLFKRYSHDFNGGLASAVGVFILIVALLLSISQIKMYDKSQK